MKSMVPAILVAALGLTLAGCAQDAPQSVDVARPAAARPADRVIVYYMHRTLRCISCLTIEKHTRKALNDAFASELRTGKVELYVEDYWTNKDLAARYDVDTVSVVVVVIVDGKEVSHENLNRVWELKGSPGELREYIAKSVRGALARARS